MTCGTPKGVPLSIFILEGSQLCAKIDGDCAGKNMIMGHMEDLFRQATIFCRERTSIAALWMPPCGFAAAMSMRIKASGLSIFPGGHMDIETFASEPMLFMRSLHMSDFSIVFEDQQGVSRVHGMTGIVPFAELCRRLHADGFRGVQPGCVKKKPQDEPARSVGRTFS